MDRHLVPSIFPLLLDEQPTSVRQTTARTTVRATGARRMTTPVWAVGLVREIDPANLPSGGPVATVRCEGSMNPPAPSRPGAAPVSCPDPPPETSPLRLLCPLGLLLAIAPAAP